MFTHPKAILIFIFVLALGVTLGCEARTGEEAGATAGETATDAAPAETAATDVESVRSAIEASNDAWATAAIAGDAAGIAALYADDAYVLIPGMDLVHGSTEIESSFRSWFEQVTLEEVTIDVEHVDVAASGDIAYVVGTYADRGTIADGTAIAESGKFAAVFENVDGEWLMVVDGWNAGAESDADAAAETTG